VTTHRDRFVRSGLIVDLRLLFDMAMLDSVVLPSRGDGCDDGDGMLPTDPDVRQQATRLTEYLRDIAASTKGDTADLDAFESCWWIAELPEGVRLAASANSQGSVLSLRHVPTPLPPPLTGALRTHVDVGKWDDPAVAEPVVSDELRAAADEDEPSPMASAYELARARRDAWLEELEAAQHPRRLYEEFRDIVKKLVRHDDEFELVLCSGLVSGVGRNGRRYWRHLLVKPLIARVDPSRSAVDISPDADAPLRLEDRRFLLDELDDDLRLVEEIRSDVDGSNNCWKVPRSTTTSVGRRCARACRSSSSTRPGPWQR
jgi:hypothetical protein